MAEPKRATLTQIGTVKAKEKKETARLCRRFQLSLVDSTEETCPDFSYAELMKNASGDKDEFSGDEDDPFADQDRAEHDKMLALAKSFEEKYANPQSSRKPKKSSLKRVQEYVDLGDGYDENDSFIDNAEAYDELVPSCLTTQHGGFYINSGKLDFRTVSDSEDEFKTTTKKKRKKNQILSDPDTSDEMPRKSEKKKSVHEGEMKKRKRKKLSSGEVTEKILSKKKKLDKEKFKSLSLGKKSAGEPKSNDTPTVAHPSAPSATTPNGLPGNPHASSLSLGKKQSEKTFSTPAVDSAIESVIDSVIMQSRAPDVSGGSDGSRSLSPVYANTISKSDLVPRLPDNLPGQITTLIDNLKQTAKESESSKSKFFSPTVNNWLLELETESRKLRCRTTIYNHLASFLPCGKETLIKRAKKLQLDQHDDKLKGLINKLRTAVNALMPPLMEKHQAEVDVVQRQKIDRLQEKVEAGSTESDDEIDKGNNSEKQKRLMLPRKKFEWDHNTRSLLLDIVRIKMEHYGMSNVRSQSAEDYLRCFMEQELVPLWPSGWMQTRLLFKESRIVHSKWAPQPAGGKARKTLPMGTVPGRVGMATTSSSTTTAVSSLTEKTPATAVAVSSTATTTTTSCVSVTMATTPSSSSSLLSPSLAGVMETHKQPPAKTLPAASPTPHTTTGPPCSSPLSSTSSSSSSSSSSSASSDSNSSRSDSSSSSPGKSASGGDHATVGIDLSLVGTPSSLAVTNRLGGAATTSSKPVDLKASSSAGFLTAHLTGQHPLSLKADSSVTAGGSGAGKNHHTLVSSSDAKVSTTSKGTPTTKPHHPSSLQLHKSTIGTSQNSHVTSASTPSVVAAKPHLASALMGAYISSAGGSSSQLQNASVSSSTAPQFAGNAGGGGATQNNTTKGAQSSGGQPAGAHHKQRSEKNHQQQSREPNRAQQTSHTQGVKVAKAVSPTVVSKNSVVYLGSSKQMTSGKGPASGAQRSSVAKGSSSSSSAQLQSTLQQQQQQALLQLSRLQQQQQHTKAGQHQAAANRTSPVQSQGLVRTSPVQQQQQQQQQQKVSLVSPRQQATSKKSPPVSAQGPLSSASFLPGGAGKSSVDAGRLTNTATTTLSSKASRSHADSTQPSAFSPVTERSASKLSLSKTTAQGFSRPDPARTYPTQKPGSLTAPPSGSSPAAGEPRFGALTLSQLQAEVLKASPGFKPTTFTHTHTSPSTTTSNRGTPQYSTTTPPSSSQPRQDNTAFRGPQRSLQTVDALTPTQIQNSTNSSKQSQHRY